MADTYRTVLRMWLWLLVSLLLVVADVQSVTLPTPGVNLALGRTAQFDVEPNYPGCRDVNDGLQLCDGIYNGCSWSDIETVGWSKGERVKLIDIDLGAASPIGQITFDTITGVGSGVSFPAAVLVFVSSDGVSYYYLCDVLTESIPQEGSVNNHRFSADGLMGWGRYVRLALISDGFYDFCDEIEIMQGSHAEGDALYIDPGPVAAADVRDYATEKIPWTTQKNATLTLLREAENAVLAREALLGSIPAVSDALDLIAAGRATVMADQTVTEADYRRGPPYRTRERAAFEAVGGLNALLWPGQPFVLWQTNDWAWLHVLDAPLGVATGASVAVDMMQNEWATAGFIITSSSIVSQEVSISASPFHGPGTIQAATILKIGHVVHAEAMGFNYRDDAVVPLEEGPVILAPGVAKRIWLTFKTRGLNVPPGSYTSTLVLAAGGVPVATVPVSLTVWPLRFPDDVSLHSNTWGYFTRQPVKGREEATAQDLADHYNTALTLHHTYIPYPKPDSEGNFTEPLDFTRMDEVLALAPETRLWLLWPGFEWGFRNLGLPESEYGTPLWEKVFTNWVTQVRDHLADQGVDRDHFAWYWLDEANSGWEWEELCLRPSVLLKATDPDMLTWMNPKANTPEGVTEIEDGLPYFDTYCVPIGNIAANAAVLDICHRTRLKSWTYVTGSEKNRDPFGYYRWFAWNAWKLELGGIGMWVYVDDNNMTFSDYVDGVSYGMIYRGDVGIIDSKRWEAWRQGIADYEYLRMLEDAVTAAVHAGVVHEALDDAQAILGPGVDDVVGANWWGGDPADRGLPDQHRLVALESLTDLAAFGGVPGSAWSGMATSTYYAVGDVYLSVNAGTSPTGTVHNANGLGLVWQGDRSDGFVPVMQFDTAKTWVRGDIMSALLQFNVGESSWGAAAHGMRVTLLSDSEDGWREPNATTPTWSPAEGPSIVFPGFAMPVGNTTQTVDVTAFANDPVHGLSVNSVLSLQLESLSKPGDNAKIGDREGYRASPMPRLIVRHKQRSTGTFTPTQDAFLDVEQVSAPAGTVNNAAGYGLWFNGNRQAGDHVPIIQFDVRARRNPPTIGGATLLFKTGNDSWEDFVQYGVEVTLLKDGEDGWSDGALHGTLFSPAEGASAAYPHFSMRYDDAVYAVDVTGLVKDPANGLGANGEITFLLEAMATPTGNNAKLGDRDLWRADMAPTLIIERTARTTLLVVR